MRKLAVLEPRRASLALPQAVDLYLADCAARNLSPCTIALNKYPLRQLTAHLGADVLPGDVTAQDIRGYLLAKASDASPSTAARYYGTLSTFFAFLARDGYIGADPMQTVRKPRISERPIEPLTQAQVQALVDSCDTKSYVGVRDRCMLLMFVDSGLRSSELAELDTLDVDAKQQLILVRNGKGGKTRRVPFGAAVLSALQKYLSRRAECDSPRMFLTQFGEPIDRYGIRRIVAAAGERAGIAIGGAHLLRHSCAVAMLRNGSDAFTVQRLLGHSSLSMTRRYSELADTDVQERHRLCSPADRLTDNTANGGKRTKLR